jgi:hypothetical protein
MISFSKIISELKNQKDLKRKIKKIIRTKKAIIALGAIIIAVGGYFLISNHINSGKNDQKQAYDVLIMVHDQTNSDPAEDRRTSMKTGDVLVVQPQGHEWSNTEKISYLILKMNLTEAQAAKLTQAKEREVTEKELSAEEKTRMEEEKKRAKDENREYRPEPKRETLIAREYFIDLRSEFPDFKDIDLLAGQPFLDKVYDWGIVSRKK